MSDLVILLGAGFSHAAGLPLAANLFSAGALPRAQTPLTERRHREVMSAYVAWAGGQKNPRAEEWLKELYTERRNPNQRAIQGATWGDALRFLLSRLTPLPAGTNQHYYYGICSETLGGIHPDHSSFWNRMRSDYGTPHVVTLNYDLLVEQACRAPCNTHRRSVPMCYYGGFQRVQAVRKMTDVTTRAYELVELGTEFALYKLHGSVNWACEPHSPSIKIHQDVRAVFRQSDRFGVPAIIPPIPEKKMPTEFAQIWEEAGRVLAASPRWLVCGCSLPPYDFALKVLIRRALHNGCRKSVVLLAPDSDSLIPRWTALSPRGTKITALPGLPDALSCQWF